MIATAPGAAPKADLRRAVGRVAGDPGSGAGGAFEPNAGGAGAGAAADCFSSGTGARRPGLFQFRHRGRRRAPTSVVPGSGNGAPSVGSTAGEGAAVEAEAVGRARPSPTVASSVGGAAAGGCLTTLGPDDAGTAAPHSAFQLR